LLLSRNALASRVETLRVCSPFSTTIPSFEKIKLRKKGNRKKKEYKRPAPGERKALRKRIVLSNTNAIEVPALHNLDNQLLKDGFSAGQVLGINDPTIDFLRAINAFKSSQGWHHFRRPATLVRKETVNLHKLLQETALDSTRKTFRRIITGERLAGKSVLLLQALAMGFLKEWVVINIPEGTFL
jgi:small subunit ribosomal protein S29